VRTRMPGGVAAGTGPHGSVSASRLTPGLWGAGLLSVLFLLGGVRLFGVLLLQLFGLILLAFLVAHGITPF